MTKYVVLAANDNGTWGVFADDVAASSPKRAIAALKVESGEYVAIPARSWKRLSVSVKQTVKVTIG